MEDESEEAGWLKPKQSYKLKRTISRKRPANSNRSLPVISQSTKRKNCEDDDSLATKKQRLGQIFSPSSNFLKSRTLPPSLPSLLQRRIDQHSQEFKGEEIFNS